MLLSLQDTRLNLTPTPNEGNLLPSCGMEREKCLIIYSMSRLTLWGTADPSISLVWSNSDMNY